MREAGPLPETERLLLRAVVPYLGINIRDGAAGIHNSCLKSSRGNTLPTYSSSCLEPKAPPFPVGPLAV